MKLLLVLTALALCRFTPAWAQPQREKLAQPPAESWLKVIDAGKYAESWTAASEVFKQLVTQQQWTSAMQQARLPLGKLENRTFKSAQYSQTLPGAPAGEYVIIVYDTSFEKRKASEETVTMKQEQDGRWKSAGYFIK